MIATIRVGTPSIGNDSAEDRFVAAKRASPDFGRQRAHIFGAGQRIGARELPTSQRRDTENRHQLGRDHRRHDTSRLIRRSKIHGPGPIRADIVEGSGSARGTR